MAAEDVRHRLGDRGGADHTDLHGIDPDVVEHGIDLVGDEGRFHQSEAADAARILHRHRGHCRHAVGAKGGEGLEVGSDAGAAARVDAGNGEDVGDGHGTLLSAPPIGSVIPAKVGIYC
jgi:hypothetical protein